MKGKLFAISGSPASEKNSVLNRVMQLRDRVQYSVSATSRPMRPGEIDGKSYYFVTREQFEQMIAAGELLEQPNTSATTTARPLKPILSRACSWNRRRDGRGCGRCAEHQKAPAGGSSCLHGCTVDGRDPPQTANRGDVPPELMEKRMERAKWEYSQAGQYDYLVVNDTVEHAAQELLAIMTAEKCKMMDRIHCIKEEL